MGKEFDVTSRSFFVPITHSIYSCYQLKFAYMHFF